MDIKKVSTSWEKEVESLWFRNRERERTEALIGGPGFYLSGLKPRVSGGWRRK